MYVLTLVFFLLSGPVTVRLGPSVPIYSCEVALSLLPSSPVPGVAACVPTGALWVAA